MQMEATNAIDHAFAEVEISVTENAKKKSHPCA
jgi:hypothetical protein